MKTVILFFCLGFSCTCLSQGKEFIEGSFVNQKGDTIKGFFQKKYSTSFKDLKFTQNIAGNIFSAIIIDSCKAVCLENDYYTVWHGKRGMAYIDRFNFEIQNIDSFLTETIPLKLLFQGSRLSLYHYYDLTDHFFVGLNDSIQELMISYRYPTDWEKSKYVRNVPAYEINPIYRYQIIALLNNELSKKQKFLVDRSEYDKYALIRLFKKIDPIVKK
ncbi:MAG: hypothetical protein IPP48_09810 [Chitinophagaceae bacterium]|nr:hypothetical protein [Chitinophagaceae bacterium]